MGVVPVEPAIAYGCVHFSRLVVEPSAFNEFVSSAQVIGHQVIEMRKRVRVLHIRNHVPFSGSGASLLIAAPSEIFASEDGGLWGQGAYEFFPCLIIIGLSALAFRVGAVQPHFGNRPVFGKELEKLVQIVFVVVIHIESEPGLVRERSAGHLTRNSPQ